MRHRVARQAFGRLLLAVTLFVVAAPSDALAAGPRRADDGGGWALVWQRLADGWNGMRDAMTGLVPTWERDTTPTRTVPPPPTEPPPPEEGDPFDDGDTGSGLDPNG